MNRTHRSASVGWAMILLAISAMALAGCGRKGGLDLPSTSTAAPVAAVEEERPASAGVLFAPVNGDANPVAAKGSKRSFVLDPLLN